MQIYCDVGWNIFDFFRAVICLYTADYISFGNNGSWAAARLSGLFQQTDDKDTRGRRVFGRVKNISYFLDHVETVRMCTASVSSQTCRPVLQGYVKSPHYNRRPLYGHPLKGPLLRDIVLTQYPVHFLKHVPKSFHGSSEVIGRCRQKHVHSISRHTLIKVAAQPVIWL